MPRKKICTTVYITPEQNEKLKALHRATRIPVAVFIREGIDLVLDKYRDRLPGQLAWRELLEPEAAASVPSWDPTPSGPRKAAEREEGASQASLDGRLERRAAGR